jgi:serine/threonine protein kinase
MASETEPIHPQPRTKSEGTTLVWLDALASGHCSPEIFLDAMQQRFRTDREETWEVLSLLDQYYRRGRIKPETFHTLKSRLQNSALDADEDMSASLAAKPAASAPAGRAASAAAAVTTPVDGARPVPAPPPNARSAAREPAIGDILRDRYALRGLIGRGSMGTVFEAVDLYRVDLPSTGQRIAVKVLHAAVSQREGLLTELQREFQHLQLLSHPNIVRVHEFDRDGGVAFFTMEFLNGALLSQVFSARQIHALPRPYAMAILRDVGAALAHAHSRGVVHGGVDPRNVAITKGGEVRVLDFGTSQRASTGTSGYASCQVLEGQHPDARDDVFAFACLACVLLSGQHPFRNRNAIDACAQRVRPARPPKLANRQWRILREGLRWEREKRPPDFGVWLARLDLSGAAARLPALPELVTVTAARGRKAMLWAAAGMTVLLLAAVGYWALTMQHDSLPAASPPMVNQLPSSITAPAAPAAAPATPAAAPAPPLSPAPLPSPSPSPSRSLSTVPAPAATANSPPIGKPPVNIAAPPRAAAATRPASRDPVRVELAADSVDVAAGESAAHVVVRRKGSVHGDASFTWWTESGTAKPSQDFSPVMPRVEHVDDGSSTIVLSIPVSGAPHSQPKSFYVVIDRTDSGAPVGARTLTMVTLQPAD